jgi:DNA-binding CsgD family transcriptional regulator
MIVYMMGNGVTKNPLAGLTGKQREVLDLLIEHKTSKEISRSLGISPYTVDQRINLARTKLGLGSRNQVAQEYRRLLQTYEQSVYQKLDVAAVAIPLDGDGRGKFEALLTLPQAELAIPGRTTLFKERDSVEDFRACPELLDGQWGTLARLGVIAGLALIMMFVVLGGLSMFSVASNLFVH